MSLHEDIQRKMRALIGELDAEGVEVLSPLAIATLTYDEFGDKSEEIHIRYACIEHLKQMARRILGAKYDADGSENAAHQNDMFSGLLQDRYPLPPKRGEPQGYKLKELMTQAEFDWVIDQLCKSANARLEHADAVRHYANSRCAPGAAVKLP